MELLRDTQRALRLPGMKYEFGVQTALDGGKVAVDGWYASPLRIQFRLLHEGAPAEAYSLHLAAIEALPDAGAERSTLIDAIHMAMAVRNRLELHEQREQGLLAVIESAQDLSSRLDLNDLLAKHRRGEDTPEVIATRLANARHEVAQARHFDFVIINSLFETALFDLKTVVHSQRLKYAAQLRNRSQVFAALDLV